MEMKVFEKIRNASLNREPFINGKELAEYLGSIGFSKSFTWRLSTSLAELYFEEGRKLNKPINISSGFDNQRQNLSCELLTDAEEPQIFDVDRLECVKVKLPGEENLPVQLIIDTAFGCDPNYLMKVAKLGQRHCEALLRNQCFIPVKWRGKCIVFPGTTRVRSISKEVSICFMQYANGRWFYGQSFGNLLIKDRPYFLKFCDE